MPEGFDDKNKTLIMNEANGFGGSAVVIASRGEKDVMRKLEVQGPLAPAVRMALRATDERQI